MIELNNIKSDGARMTSNFLLPLPNGFTVNTNDKFVQVIMKCSKFNYVRYFETEVILREDVTQDFIEAFEKKCLDSMELL